LLLKDTWSMRLFLDVTIILNFFTILGTSATVSVALLTFKAQAPTAKYSYLLFQH